MSIEEFIEQLSSELGSRRLAGLVSGGVWYFDIMGLLPTISACIKADDNVCRYYELRLSKNTILSFMEDEVGIIDDARGILGFTRQLANALQRNIILAPCNFSSILSMIFEFDPIRSLDNRITSLTGTLQLPIIQDNVHPSVFEMIRGLHLMSSLSVRHLHSCIPKPSLSLEEGNICGLQNIKSQESNDSRQLLSDIDIQDTLTQDSVHEEEQIAKKRKKKGKFGGTSLFPARK